MSEALVAVDVDRTMIYSPAAVSLGSAAGHDAGELVQVEHYREAPASAMTARAALLWQELARVADLVPVTTRTMEQFRRVRWPGGPVRHAITTNGARLLVDGEEDLDWSAEVLSRLCEGCAPIDEVRARLGSAGPWLLRTRDAEGLFCYAIIERAALPDEELDALRGWAASRGWVVSVQGSKLYCLPAPLTKSAAAEALARRLGSDMTLAAGDSLLDADLLSWAQHAIRPSHGELHDAGWSCDGLAIAPGIGPLAGEQILRWALDRVGSLTARTR